MSHGLDTMADPEESKVSLPPYSSGLEYVLDVLACLDRHLSRMMARQPEPEEASLRGLVITDAEVRRLVKTETASAAPETAPRFSIGGKLWSHAQERLAATRQPLVLLPAEILRERFGLSVFEMECLLLCLDRKSVV